MSMSIVGNSASGSQGHTRLDRPKSVWRQGRRPALQKPSPDTRCPADLRSGKHSPDTLSNTVVTASAAVDAAGNYRCRSNEAELQMERSHTELGNEQIWLGILLHEQVSFALRPQVPRPMSGEG